MGSKKARPSSAAIVKDHIAKSENINKDSFDKTKEGGALGLFFMQPA